MNNYQSPNVLCQLQKKLDEFPEIKPEQWKIDFVKELALILGMKFAHLSIDEELMTISWNREKVCVWVSNDKRVSITWSNKDDEGKNKFPDIKTFHISDPQLFHFLKEQQL